MSLAFIHVLYSFKNNSLFLGQKCIRADSFIFMLRTRHRNVGENVILSTDLCMVQRTFGVFDNVQDRDIRILQIQI